MSDSSRLTAGPPAIVNLLLASQSGDGGHNRGVKRLGGACRSSRQRAHVRQ